MLLLKAENPTTNFTNFTNKTNIKFVKFVEFVVLPFYTALVVQRELGNQNAPRSGGFTAL
jgi:hypothetical protein